MASTEGLLPLFDPPTGPVGDRTWTVRRRCSSHIRGDAVEVAYHSAGWELPSNRGGGAQYCHRMSEELTERRPDGRTVTVIASVPRCPEPAVWRVVRRCRGTAASHWCDAHLPAESRPGSPEAEVADRAWAHAVEKRRLTDEDKLHRYVNRIGWVENIPEGHYAIEDPHEPERVTLWRVRNGKLLAWPPNVRVGPPVRFFHRDVPTDPEERRRFWADVRTRATLYHADVLLLIKEAPERAAARYAAVEGRCSCCGRALTDPESIGYGLGSECRRWLPAAAKALAATRASLQAAP